MRGKGHIRGVEQNCGLSQTAEDKVERSKTVPGEGMETIKLTGKHDAALKGIPGLAIPVSHPLFAPFLIGFEQMLSNS